MKPFFAIVTGFVVSFAMFAGGGGLAAYYLAAEPVRDIEQRQDVAAMWSADPKRVDPSEQDFERIETAAAPADDTQDEEVLVAMADPQSANDATATASEPTTPDQLTMAAAAGEMDETKDQQPAATKPEPQANRLPAAHVAWCEDRFRSYRRETNSYRPYSGGTKPCVSPFLEGQQAARSSAPAPTEERETAAQPLAYAAQDAAPRQRVTMEHVQDCFNRYRSYRMEDNTYQPYGGGPRQQCQ
ncbi:BA14K family protein [Pararhizobium haloflavum]|uniref:BA14K family protein n=1 Tax=Pararhizobium haloflavum TaxID=2037914 RepID=UPI000C19D6C0|nr:BA14K family protein [Pararhizobium haloflavum]